MTDLITLGSISADLYFSADNLTTRDKRFFLAKGGKYTSDKFYFSVGGGAANVAIGTKKNGLKTSVCAIIGNNVFRKSILHTLKLKGVSAKLAIFRQNYTNASSILLTDDGERTIIHHETLHEHLGDSQRIANKLKKARAIYLGNLPDISLTERIEILRRLKRENIFIFGNLGTRDCQRPKEQISKLISYFDVLILNAHEFSELVKKPYEKVDFKKDVSQLLPLPKGKVLVVTDASKGSFGYQNKLVNYQKAISPKKIIDSTGVGDAYTAGFIASYLKHEDLQLAMKKGAQYAARILGKLGAN